MPYVRVVEARGKLEWMEASRRKTIKYTQEVLKTIMAYCTKDDLRGLEKYIESLISS